MESRLVIFFSLKFCLSFPLWSLEFVKKSVCAQIAVRHFFDIHLFGSKVQMPVEWNDVSFLLIQFIALHFGFNYGKPENTQHRPRQNEPFYWRSKRDESVSNRAQRISNSFCAIHPLPPQRYDFIVWAPFILNANHPKWVLFSQSIGRLLLVFV